MACQDSKPGHIAPGRPLPGIQLGYTVTDSGEREHFDSGMQRDTAKGKPNPLLVRDGPMYQRWVAHLTAGAEKYDARNWMKAEGIEEFERFLESACRHFDVWLAARLDELAYWRIGDIFEPVDTPEDEAAATFFNMNGVEFVREVMND